MTSEEKIFDNRIDKINKLNQLYENLIDKPSQNEGYDIIESLLISAMSFCLATQPTEEESENFLKPEYSRIEEEEEKKNYTFKFKNYKVVFNVIETCGDGKCLLNALLGIRSVEHQSKESKKSIISSFEKENKNISLKDNGRFFKREVLDLFCLKKQISYININKYTNEIEYFLNPNTINFDKLRIISYNGKNHYEQISWDIYSEQPQQPQKNINKKTERTCFNIYTKAKNDYILNILKRYNYATPEKKKYIYSPYWYENKKSKNLKYFEPLEKEILKGIKEEQIREREYFYKYSNFGHNFDINKKKYEY